VDGVVGGGGERIENCGGEDTELEEGERGKTLRER